MKQRAPGRTRNMTVGSPAGHLFAFTMPLLAGSFLQQMYNMVDSWVVGQYVGDSALAAVGMGFPVIFFFTSLFMGLSNGGTVVIAQYYGAGQMDRVRDAVDTIYTSFLAAAIPLTAIALLLVKPVLALLRVEADAYYDAGVYLAVVCAGLVGNIGYNLNAGILRGLGNSRSTLLFLAIAAVMNIILDLVFVLVFSWGVFGVAFATILSQAASWVFGIFYINRCYPEMAIRFRSRGFHKDLFRRIMAIGLPSGIQMSLISLGSMAVMSKINTFGKEFTAGYNVGYKMDQMAFLPMQSLSNAITAFVGQNVGAQRMDRVRQGVRVTVISSVVWCVFVAALLMPTAEVLIGSFSDTPAVIAAGAAYLRAVMPFFTPFSIMFCLNNAMRGAGESMFPMVNSLFSVIIVRVACVYWLADHFGPGYMFYGFGIGWTVGCLVAAVYYLSGRWTRRGSIAAQPVADES